MSPAPAASPKNNTQASPKLNLFWRTFILLVVLMGGGTLAWFQTYRILELGPQNRAIASQVAELLRVNAALLDHLSREDEQKVFTALEESKHVRFQTALPSDVVLPFKPQDALGIALSAAIQPTFDQPIVLAESVNGSAGIWVRVHVQNRDIWLTLNDLRHEGPSDETWLFWIGIAGVFSLAGAAAIAQLLNRPLTQIVYATGRVQDGNFHDAFLDENVLIHEVSLVNRRFNEMTAQLAKMEADRALMLAGISHDLRTPLARIRLELEMSVSDPVALDSIAQDIEQLDHIIDKFLDYARPMTKPLAPVAVIPIVEQVCQTFADHPHLSITQDLTTQAHANPKAWVDPVDLMRILNNLLENAARYGLSPGQAKAEVHVSLYLYDPWIVLKVRDQGSGVAPNTLKHLTEPFYRGDAARSQANGSGLGLAIVAQTLQRMKGRFKLSNHPQGGLMATIRIRAA